MSAAGKKVPSHLSFTVRRSALDDRILIPKYYNPELAQAISAADSDFDLLRLGDVLSPGRSGSQLGVWLPREHYGTGSVPYVRTSDLLHWKVRPDFKMGISPEVAERFKVRCDVNSGDILFVAHGTYLIGEVALVRHANLPLVLQDHVYRLRISKSAALDPEVLLAAMSTAFVRRQVRSRQFSAEILDKIGDRHLGIRVPVPKAPEVRARVANLVSSVLASHQLVDAAIRSAVDGETRSPLKSGERLTFQRKRSSLTGRILLPRYYDPELDKDIALAEAEESVPWQSIGDLQDQKIVSVSTGIEVGKLAYGTGDIPFLRTSDVAQWEVRRDSTHGISRAIYERVKSKAELRARDILLVRDGTYLVGASAMILEEDLPATFCGGLFRIRVSRHSGLTPFALLGLLNLPLVRRQFRAKQFTRDIIDTLGPRLAEVRVPGIASKTCRNMHTHVQAIMARKARIKLEMEEAIRLVEPAGATTDYERPSWSMR